MEANFQQLSRVKELAFMGKMTASLSHEIKNTLAIINEAVGLMGDLLNREPPVGWQAYPRLKSIIPSIEDQVQRSAGICKRLNRFAHSMDKAVADVDVNEVVGEITTLAQRFAALRRVRLEIELHSQPLHILSDPFRIQYVIFGLIEGALTRSPEQGKVTVTSDLSGDWTQVMIIDEGLPEAESLRKQITAALTAGTAVEEGENSDVGTLVLTMAELGGSIEAEELGESGNKITLSFPKKIPAI